MKTEEIELSYMGVTASVEGLKCPKCGTIYCEEKVVEEKILRGESLIENK